MLESSTISLYSGGKLVGSYFEEEYSNVIVDHKLTMGQEHYIVIKKGGRILKSSEMDIACLK